MVIILLNNSRKKAFRKSKRIISAVLPAITNRINIGDIPKRVLFQLIKNLKETVNRGTNIKIFVASKNGFRGFKCIEIGKKSPQLIEYTNALSSIDKELKLFKIIEKINI